MLDIDERGGRFRLRAHPTHRQRGRFEDGWSRWRSDEDLAVIWPAVTAYLDRIVACVDARWTDSEGEVHALISAGEHLGISVINREASISFRNNKIKSDRCDSWSDRIHAAVTASGDGSAWCALLSQKRLGTSPDFIAVDAQGRLLVLEAKPASATGGLAWGPAQVRFYALMYGAWLEATPGAADRLEQELQQRKQLGLLPEAARTSLQRPVQVVPVLAVGPGVVSPEAWPRLRAVQQAVQGAAEMSAVQPLEIWLLSADEAPTVWAWDDPAAPAPVPRAEDLARSTYSERARASAVAWKLSRLPEAARDDGPYRSGGNVYPFCLPLAERRHNLLAEARGAVDFFAQRKIQWHAGIAGGPTNHLLSSQVQCVNALQPMTGDPELVKRSFAPHLSIAEVLEIEDDAWLTFEYVGDADHLNEGPQLTRGANRTSADAAIRYRSHDGHIEIALIEWKYTERYAGSALPVSRKGIRERRYRDLWDNDDGPILSGDAGGPGPLPYEAMFVEPFYRLVRQQMLAWRMELAHEKGADLVRVLHISPKANVAYQSSLRGAHPEVGDTVSDV